MNINKILNAGIRERWQNTEWQSIAVKKFNLQSLLIWGGIACVFFILGVVLFFSIQVQGVNIVVLALFIVLGLSFVLVAVVRAKGRENALCAADNKGIYYTWMIFAKNNNTTWFEEGYNNIASCEINFNKDKSRATFIFKFKEQSYGGSLMGMLSQIKFENVCESEKLLEIIKTNDVECYFNN